MNKILFALFDSVFIYSGGVLLTVRSLTFFFHSREETVLTRRPGTSIHVLWLKVTHVFAHFILECMSQILKVNHFFGDNFFLSIILF